MRWLLFSFLSLISACPIAAQQPVFPGENSVVRDSTGRQYTYQEWQPLVKRDYTLRTAKTNNPGAGEFILVKLTGEQVAERVRRENERMEKLPKPRESNSFKTGERMSSFTTTTLDGNKISLKEMKGKIVVLNFWFTNCNPCRKEIPALNDLVDSFDTAKVVFIAIALDGKDMLKTFLEKQPFKYSIVNNGQFLANRYGIRFYPTHVIIDQEGRIFFHTTGLATNTVYWLNKSIHELLTKEAATQNAG